MSIRDDFPRNIRKIRAFKFQQDNKNCKNLKMPKVLEDIKVEGV